MSTITPEQWKQLSPYLDEALELFPEQRTEWLLSLSERDAELASMVRDLLDEQQQVAREGFLEKSPLQTSRGLAGQEVGSYRLVSQIGHGGMGSVWLAQRNDGRFERKAAVKFLNIALTGQATEERFKREGSILGRLTHPHIAELLDAGVTLNGEPYLVLEHVEGKNIDEYCDRHKLDVDARIKLFLDVLEAVAHAHANLVVHRDLKPSNVLVTDDGKVKLLDFGIAKLLSDERNPDVTALTVEGGGALTPLFAAPEQVTAGTVTTATDVYALGALLYILLTGQHPAGSVPHSPAELLKAIVEIEPAPASEVIFSAASKDRAEKRGTNAEKLRRQLRGDLDTILAKTLKKAPAERYSSVIALASDLTRYLNHEPISARPDTVAYRARKFVRRNRTSVILGATAITLVIGSLATGLLIANRERKIAERRFAQVRQLANRFVALDNNIRGLPGSTKVRMQIVSDSLQYLTSLGSDVQGDTDLALEIAYAYVRVAHVQGDPTSPNLGQFPEAEASLDKAENFVDSVLRVDPKNRKGLFIAATIAHDRMVLADEQNRKEEVVSWANRASERVERFMSLGDVDLKDVYSMGYFEANIAYSCDDTRHFTEALRVGQRAVDIMQPVASAHPGLRGAVLESSAIARWQTGDLDGALQTEQQAIPLQETDAAGGHASLRVNLANTLYTEGMILGKQDAEPSLGRSREALAALQRGMGIAEELAKMDSLDYLSRHSVATISLEMGNILRHSEPEKALAAYDHALVRIREAKTNVSTQLSAADLLAASSYVLRWLGQEKEARRRIEEAFRLLRDAHQYPAETVEPMSGSYRVIRAAVDDDAEMGQTDQAIEAYQQLLDKLMAWKPDLQNDLRDATCISRTWTALANLLRRAGRISEAERLEAQRTDLWSHWNSRLPNAQFLLRQSLSQIAPQATFLVMSRH